MTQSEKAEALRRLHAGPRILRLCNVWDAASARIVELAGFPAVATGSAGIAYSLGYPDGEAIPPAGMLAQVRSIARAVSVPVTADLEAGYGDIEQTVEGLIEAGGAGMNLEDYQQGALLGLPAQLAKIRAVRRIGERMGVPVVVNARTEIYLAALGDPSTRFERSCERLAAYRDEGADCLFIPGVRDEETIVRLVATLRFPINILGAAGGLSAGHLQRLGVARVSVGSGPMRATMGLMRRIAEEMRDGGTFDCMGEGTIPYPGANAMFA